MGTVRCATARELLLNDQAGARNADIITLRPIWAQNPASCYQSAELIAPEANLKPGPRMKPKAAKASTLNPAPVNTRAVKPLQEPTCACLYVRIYACTPALCICVLVCLYVCARISEKYVQHVACLRYA